VLIVPTHPMSRNRGYAGVRCALGVVVCRHHYENLTLHEFLSKPEIRASIENDFRENAAMPHFERARFTFVWHKQAEFQDLMQRRERARQGGQAVPGVGIN